MDINRKIWNSLHTESRHRTKYPAEDAVRFIMRNFERDGKERFLDMGCGAGRHIMLAANENIIPYGVDFSHEGVLFTKELLQTNGYENFVDNIIECGVDEVPFEDEFFDGIISFGVLYYLDLTGIKKSISEIYRILKPGGHGLVVIRNTEDYRYVDAIGKGEADSHGDVLIRDEGVQRSASKENGMHMHFFTRDEVKDLFCDFHELEINTMSTGHENDSYKDSDFLVTFCK